MSPGPGSDLLDCRGPLVLSQFPPAFPGNFRVHSASGPESVGTLGGRQAGGFYP